MRRLYKNFKYSDATFFCTTLRCADYIKISSQSDQHCCQLISSKLRFLCPPYLKNGLNQLKNFLYSILKLLNSEYPF
ncbi:hypothetical protein O3M35_005451 [Rhynocoris fuscipes]|uniref:Uncharacterized protein n=1 Tax=Rhynocoris fuscipes TaxID=488301 RepID=A0AAW1DIP7_9HEMI